MARNFPGAGTDYLDVGQPTGAEFSATADWTAMTFARLDGVSTADEGAFISKWSALSARRRFELYHTKNDATPNVIVAMNSATKITGTYGMSADTWYLIAVSNNGSTNNLTLKIIGMDGTVHESSTGTSANSDSNTEDIELGARLGGDPLDGDLFASIYVDAELTESQIKQYLYAPFRMGALWKQQYGVSYFAPILGTSTEPDWSDNNVTVTVNGSSSVSADNPPVSTFIGFDNTVVLPTAAGGDITESPPNGTLTLTGGGNKQTMLMRHKIPPQGT